MTNPKDELAPVEPKPEEPKNESKDEGTNGGKAPETTGPNSPSTGVSSQGSDAKSIGKPEAGEKPSPAGTADGDAPPPPPRRPKLERKESNFSQNLKELQSAFPDTDASLCRALLVAAGNDLESAFTGHLALSDETIRPNIYVREQISNDERLARRLAADQHRVLHRRQKRPEGVPRTMHDSRSQNTFWDTLKQRFNGEVYDEDPQEYYEEDENLPGVPINRRISRPRNNAASSQNAPKLPPRTRSQEASEIRPDHVRKSREPRKEIVPEKHSVNAFGDIQTAKSEDQEPDAFFIGDSDDELGSLDEEDDESEKQSSTTPKEEPKDEPKDNSKEESKEENKEETKGAKETKESEAQSLLNKVKSQANKK